MNPQSLMQFMGAIGKFKSNHPKFANFIEMFIRDGIPEGSVIEISVTRPDGEPVTTNMRVQASDIELLQSLRNMR